MNPLALAFSHASAALPDWISALRTVKPTDPPRRIAEAARQAQSDWDTASESRHHLDDCRVSERLRRLVSVCDQLEPPSP